MHLIVDGSLLSSYPVWIFSRNCLSPSLPTIGFDFVGDRACPAVCHSKSWPEFFCYLGMVISTSMNAVDKQQADKVCHNGAKPEHQHKAHDDHCALPDAGTI